MTTATATVTEFTQAQIAHRRACAFLKGILCGHSEQCGHPYHTTKDRDPDFEKGFSISREEYMSPERITALHIIHNRLRHTRPHITAEYDANETGWLAERLIEKHLGKGTFELATQQAELEKEARDE